MGWILKLKCNESNVIGIDENMDLLNIGYRQEKKQCYININAGNKLEKVV